MASQMAPAVFDTTTVDFELRPEGGAYRSGVDSYVFRSTGSVVKFQGFLALYREAREEGDAKAVTVQRALGHASATTTLRTYAHLWPTAEDRTRRAARSLMRTALAPAADSSRTAEA